VSGKTKSVVAWRKVVKPKRKGGLGVVDLEAQNEALLLKHLEKFYYRKEIPWVDLVWNSHYQNNLVPHAENDK